jgi:hypothetical protein
MRFLDGEWLRFVEQYLDKPSDNSLDKTRKIHDDTFFTVAMHLIKGFSDSYPALFKLYLHQGQTT